MMPAREWVRLPVQLTPAQHAYLRRRAFDEGRSIADVVRGLVEEDRLRTGAQMDLGLNGEAEPTAEASAARRLR
jgi:hypothetical protein